MKSGFGNGGMHRQVSWMVPADGSILRYMAAATDERGDPADQSPQTIAWNTGYSRSHVSNRCQRLSDAYLLTRVDRGRYHISDKGIGLVKGSVSPEEVEEESDSGDT